MSLAWIAEHLRMGGGGSVFTSHTMEKFTIEIETSAGWVMFHSIMRPSEDRALTILKELREKYSQSNLRVVKWIGTPIEA